MRPRRWGALLLALLGLVLSKASALSIHYHKTGHGVAFKLKNELAKTGFQAAQPKLRRQP